jgi:hypothetical protein
MTKTATYIVGICEMAHICEADCKAFNDHLDHSVPHECVFNMSGCMTYACSAALDDPTMRGARCIPIEEPKDER